MIAATDLLQADRVYRVRAYLPWAPPDRRDRYDGPYFSPRVAELRAIAIRRELGSDAIVSVESSPLTWEA